jgi:hypothetical protein
MKWTTRNNIGIPIIMLFLIFLALSFVIYPEIGEKILYGKHPPEENSRSLEYSDIILSKNYDCMESASLKAKGELPKFVKEFNECNS